MNEAQEELLIVKRIVYIDQNLLGELTETGGGGQPRQAFTDWA